MYFKQPRSRDFFLGRGPRNEVVFKNKRPYVTLRLDDSGRQNDQEMLGKTGNAQSCATLFRHSAVPDLPAVPLREVHI